MVEGKNAFNAIVVMFLVVFANILGTSLPKASKSSAAPLATSGGKGAPR